MFSNIKVALALAAGDAIEIGWIRTIAVTVPLAPPCSLEAETGPGECARVSARVR
jgi:hypothetical protein